MAFKQDNKKNGFSRISIGLASPDEIMRLSSGEILKPETINYVNDCEHCFYCEAVCNKDAIKVIPDYKSERLFQSFERYN